MKSRERERQLSTSDIVIVFARQGVAIETMARALAQPVESIATICRRACAAETLLSMPPQSPSDARGAMQVEIVHLRDELDQAKRLNRELQDATERERFGFHGVAELTEKEAEVVEVLARHGQASKARIYDAIYGLCLDQDRPEPKIVDVFVCKVRKKLAPHGIEIGTLWGRGYEMSPRNVARLRDLAGTTCDAPSLAPAIADMVA